LTNKISHLDIVLGPEVVEEGGGEGEEGGALGTPQP